MQGQSSLFEQRQESLPIVDGKLDYYSQWLTIDDANELLNSLKESVKWQKSLLNMYGKSILVPRLNAWYGDENRYYGYSGTRFKPLPWLPSLHKLKLKIESETGFGFNSVLVNYYRDENDSVAWHSDDEPELGKNPAIASVSLGAERGFQLRHRYKKTLMAPKITLEHGSMLVMSEELQHYWQHQLPKVATKTASRVNLTYRYIQ